MVETRPASSSWWHPAPAAPRRPRGVALLDSEPDLAAGLTAAEMPLARRLLVVPRVHVEEGPWTAPAGLDEALGLLVLDGMVSCECHDFGVADVRLFGPGDLVDTRLLDGGSPHTCRVLIALDLAVLDFRVAAAARRWPTLMPALMQRLFESQHEVGRLATIRSLPRVEQRVLALLSHLASRWGRVTPAGLVIHLPLTHAMLGHLVAAQRSTVTLAMTELTAQGRLERLDGHEWRLPSEALDWPTAGLPALTR